MEKARDTIRSLYSLDARVRRMWEGFTRSLTFGALLAAGPWALLFAYAIVFSSFRKHYLEGIDLLTFHEIYVATHVLSIILAALSLRVQDRVGLLWREGCELPGTGWCALWRWGAAILSAFLYVRCYLRGFRFPPAGELFYLLSFGALFFLSFLLWNRMISISATAAFRKTLRPLLFSFCAAILLVPVLSVAFGLGGIALATGVGHGLALMLISRHVRKCAFGAAPNNHQRQYVHRLVMGILLITPFLPFLWWDRLLVPLLTDLGIHLETALTPLPGVLHSLCLLFLLPVLYPFMFLVETDFYNYFTLYTGDGSYDPVVSVHTEVAFRESIVREFPRIVRFLTLLAGIIILLSWGLLRMNRAVLPTPFYRGLLSNQCVFLLFSMIVLLLNYFRITRPLKVSATAFVVAFIALRTLPSDSILFNSSMVMGLLLIPLVFYGAWIFYRRLNYPDYSYIPIFRDGEKTGPR